MATAQENPSSASHSVPGSFRSNWQAQLASLVSATDIPGSTQIRIGAFPDGSQINQQSEFVRSGAPKTSTPGIPALPNPSAGNSMFEANVPAGKGTGSPVDSGAKTPQSVHTQARLNRQRVELQESGPEAQAAEYRDAHGLSGIPSPDSSGAKPAHASKHEKSESVANHLASAPVSTSIFDGLPSVSMTMPAPIVSPAVKSSELEIHAPPPDSSATSYPDASQLSSARTPSVEGRFGVESSFADAPAGNGPDLAEKSIRSNNPPLLLSPLQPVANGTDVGSASQAGTTASISADFTNQPPATSTLPRLGEVVLASTSPLGADEVSVPDASASLPSAERGKEELHQGQTVKNDLVSHATDQVGGGATAGSIGPATTSVATSGSAARSSFPVPLGPSSQEETRTPQSSVGPAAGDLIPPSPASVLEGSRVSRVSSAGKVQRVPIPLSLGSHPMPAILATPNQTPALDRDSPLGTSVDVSPLHSAAAGADTSVSRQANGQSFEPEPPLAPGSPNFELQIPLLQAQLGILNAESQSTAISSNNGVLKNEPGSSAALISKSERPKAEGTAAASETIRSSVSRNTHSTPTHQAPATGPSALQSEIVTPLGEPSALVRDLTTEHALQNRAQGSIGVATGSTTPAAREAFSEIDNSSPPDAVSWTHVDAHRAEAGIQDPGLGWIGVRADRSAGQIQATLVPGSTDAAQALGGQMAGLNAYLTEAHTHVQSLRIAQPEGQQSAFSAGSGQGQGTGQSPEQGMSQNPGKDNASGSSQNFNPAVPASPNAVQAKLQAVSTGRFTQPAGLVELSGAHISVIA